MPDLMNQQIHEQLQTLGIPYILGQGQLLVYIANVEQLNYGQNHIEILNSFQPDLVPLLTALSAFDELRGSISTLTESLAEACINNKSEKGQTALTKAATTVRDLSMVITAGKIIGPGAMDLFQKAEPLIHNLLKALGA